MPRLSAPFDYHEFIYTTQHLASQPGFRRVARIATSGFTIVELLIVIVIIGILAAIVIVAYNGMTDRANIAHRQSDVDAVKKFLDVYYVDHGHYMKSDNFLNANAAAALASGPLKGLPPEALRAPGASSSTVSSWGQWAGDVTDSGKDYAIKTFLADGSTNCVGSSYNDSDCVKYVLYYKVGTNSDGTYKAKSISSS